MQNKGALTQYSLAARDILMLRSDTLPLSADISSLTGDKTPFSADVLSLTGDNLPLTADIFSNATDTLLLTHSPLPANVLSTSSREFTQRFNFSRTSLLMLWQDDPLETREENSPLLQI